MNTLLTYRAGGSVKQLRHIGGGMLTLSASLILLLLFFLSRTNLQFFIRAISAPVITQSHTWSVYNMNELEGEPVDDEQMLFSRFSLRLRGLTERSTKSTDRTMGISVSPIIRTLRGSTATEDNYQNLWHNNNTKLDATKHRPRGCTRI